MIVYAVNVAALKFSVESVVESIVSQYEHRFVPKCSLSETTADQEIQIYINGQILSIVIPLCLQPWIAILAVARNGISLIPINS